MPQRSVWYTFTTPESAIVEIDTLGSTYDTSLTVTTSCGGSCTSYVECADDSGGKQSQVTLDATAGTVYRIMVELQEGAACPVGGCQLVLNVERAREHTVELRVNASAPDCYVGTSLRTSRTLASDSDYRSGTGSAIASVTGVGRTFPERLRFGVQHVHPPAGRLALGRRRARRAARECAAGIEEPLDLRQRDPGGRRRPRGGAGLRPWYEHLDLLSGPHGGPREPHCNHEATQRSGGSPRGRARTTTDDGRVSTRSRSRSGIRRDKEDSASRELTMTSVTVR